MKLTEITIDGYKGTPNTHLSDLGGGLNVIYSDRVATRRAIADFIPDVMHGYDSQSRPTTMWANGFLRIDVDGQNYRLSRNPTHSASQLSISDAHGVHLTQQESGFFSNLDQSRFGIYYFTSLQDASWNWQNFMGRLTAHFDLQGTQPNQPMPFLTDRARHDTWKHAAEGRIARLNSIIREIKNLNAERGRLINDQSHIAGDSKSRLQAIDQELVEIQSQHSPLSVLLETEREKQEDLDLQIHELTRWIEEQETRLPTEAIHSTAPNHLQSIYEQLDEVDYQIRLWRSAQASVQEQRVRLRDEMVAQGDLKIDSHDHPYHEAREILLTLESRLNAAHKSARSWEKAPTPIESSTRLTSLCDEMRNDLQALCEELENQYKHVRHKAAIAELRQLRRFYHEMDENVKRLWVRRESVIEQVRRWDSAGANAIVQGEQDFTICAEREGLWSARQKHVAAPINESVESVFLSAESRLELENAKTRLIGLKAVRNRCREHIAELNTKLANLEPERLRRIEERNRLVGMVNQDYSTRQEILESKIKLLETEKLALQNQVESDRPWLNWTPNRLLHDANHFLQQLSNHSLRAISLENPAPVTVKRNDNLVISASDLSAYEQGLIRLSLSLAAIDHLALKGIRWPVLIEDCEFHSDDRAVVRLLETFCQQGHQVILITGNRLRLEQPEAFDSTRFELPDTSITSPSWYPETPYQPRESEPIHPLPAANTPWNSSLQLKNLNTETIATSDWLAATSITTVNPETLTPTPLIAVPRSCCTRQTNLQDIDLVESIYLTSMESLGIQTVGQLLDMDLKVQKTDLKRRGFNLEQIDRWQAQAWLLICFPDMTATEARVLLGCGIDRPELLDTRDQETILDDIRHYLDTSAGRRSNATYAQFSKDRLHRWAQRVRTDNGWRTYQRTFVQSPQLADHPVESGHKKPRLGKRQAAARRNIRQPALHEGSKPETRQSAQTKVAISKDSFKFFLLPTDELEAAPSIGPKTAEKFIEIGIVTVQDFLDASIPDMVKRLNNRRLSKKVLKTWQEQSRLMCEVPNLRGHDAQILVGCEILQAADLANWDANELLEIVLPFVETKEGSRILRNGKKPDLAEVTGWVKAANFVGTRKAA